MHDDTGELVIDKVALILREVVVLIDKKDSYRIANWSVRLKEGLTATTGAVIPLFFPSMCGGKETVGKIRATN